MFSALPLKADIRRTGWDVRSVPEGDISAARGGSKATGSQAALHSFSIISNTASKYGLLVSHRSGDRPKSMRPSARGCHGPRPAWRFGAEACRLVRLQ